MRDVLRGSGDYRALKFDIARRDMADVVVELQPVRAALLAQKEHLGSGCSESH